MRKPSAQVSERMRAVRTSGTALELAVKEVVRNLGVRYRLNVITLPDKPDLPNKSQGWAIFVNDCMWHGHACAEKRQPKANKSFWKIKIQSNRERDARNRKRLRMAGLDFLDVWQCEIQKLGVAQRKIRRFFRNRA